MSGSTRVVLVDDQNRFAVELDDMLRKHFHRPDEAARHHARAKARLEEELPRHQGVAARAFENAVVEATDAKPSAYKEDPWPDDWEQVDDDDHNPLNPRRGYPEGEPVTLRFHLSQVSGGKLSILVTFDPLPAKGALERFSRALRQTT